jgi:hypothetical protein
MNMERQISICKFYVNEWKITGWSYHEFFAFRPKRHQKAGFLRLDIFEYSYRNIEDELC